MQRASNKLWKDSASLIIMARNEATNKTSDYNYDLLVMKRSEKTSFMKNSIVFPGGQIAKADDAKEWVSLYKSLGITDSKLKEVSDITGPRPMLFQKTENDYMEKDISLRITAFRETFEELGVLICKNEEQFQRNDNYTNFFDKFDILHWQNLVHNDSSQFLKLCSELKVAPDLWNSWEWSAWLTPAVLFPRRFAVAFYIVALEEKPKIYPEKHEVQDYMWATIKDLTILHNKQEIWLPPPQQYEFLKMMQINQMENLMDFAKKRQKFSTTMFFPIQYITNDKFVQILPGDDFYPKTVDYTFANNIDKFKEKTAEEIRKDVKNLHRTEYSSMHNNNVFINVPSPNSHLLPINEFSINNKL